jgi:hypothetical protein
VEAILEFNKKNMAEKITYEVDVNTNKAEKSFKDIGKSADKAGDNIDGVSKSTKKLGGGADKAKSSFSSIGTIIKGGLGLGIILKLFDALSSAFMQNEQLAKMFEAAMNVVTGVINGLVEVMQPAIQWMMKLFKNPKVWWDDLVDSLKKGGQWIKDNLIDLVLNKFTQWANNAEIAVLKLRKAWNDFTGDAEESEKIQKSIEALQEQNIKLAKENAKKVENIKEVAKGVVDFYVNAVKTIVKSVQKVIDNQSFLLNWEKNLASLQRKLQEIATQSEIDSEKQRQIRDDEAVSMDERIKANQRLAEILKENQAKEIEAQKAIIAQYQGKLSVMGKNEQLSITIADEQAKLAEIENKYLGQTSEQLTNINSLRNEQLGIEKTIKDSKIETLQIERDAAEASMTIESEKIAFHIESERLLYEAKIKNIEDELAAATEGTARYAEIMAERDIINAEYTKSTKENATQLNKSLNQEDEDRLGSIKQGFAGIQALTKENSKANIAAQIGSAIIDTYVAANKALTMGVPPYNYIAMAGIIATGLANLNKIRQQASKLGAETGGDSSGGSSGGGNVGPSIGIAGGQINSNNQLSDSIKNALEKPSRSYVVGSDVSTQQGLDRRISQNATLGG